MYKVSGIKLFNLNVIAVQSSVQMSQIFGTNKTLAKVTITNVTRTVKLVRLELSHTSLFLSESVIRVHREFDFVNHVPVFVLLYVTGLCASNEGWFRTLLWFTYPVT
jgi:hypothetical protein